MAMMAITTSSSINVKASAAAPARRYRNGGLVRAELRSNFMRKRLLTLWLRYAFQRTEPVAGYGTRLAPPSNSGTMTSNGMESSANRRQSQRCAARCRCRRGSRIDDHLVAVAAAHDCDCLMDVCQREPVRDHQFWIRRSCRVARPWGHHRQWCKRSRSSASDRADRSGRARSNRWAG
jgi:hypothetical protein